MKKKHSILPEHTRHESSGPSPISSGPASSSSVARVGGGSGGGGGAEEASAAGRSGGDCGSGGCVSMMRRASKTSRAIVAASSSTRCPSAGESDPAGPLSEMRSTPRPSPVSRSSNPHSPPPQRTAHVWYTAIASPASTIARGSGTSRWSAVATPGTTEEEAETRNSLAFAESG